MSSVNPPILLALVLCDQTIREMGTNKLSLIGTFNGLYANRFPCIHPTFSVYVALTDGRGKVPCRIAMSAMGSAQSLFNLPGVVDFQDPTGVAELVFQLQQLKFDAPGDFSIEFNAQGELLGSRKLRVQLLKNP